ncbi:DNA replication and repair protein RecN [Arboricoccus pini]|uniref:DNA repair protein RecN n=1 Tax=Arboricoccus pini TaxID=1963835 RepID=A0A212QAU2_9PROT|nr:DNA repair protein RecN [Arboricoccus pini]SNB56496.1 DNA replication and repair protein RecN [Arboricoccus pini]
MLRGLSIRDIVLIDRLDLSFGAGLCVLTGETGAGKSIVLDALGLALGGRADRALVRPGTSQGVVTAAFEPPVDHPLWEALKEQGQEEAASEGQVVLRRILTADGRSRAFVNDEPVSTQFLRRLGHSLIEVHGQNDQHELASGNRQRWLLDAFAGQEALVRRTEAAYGAWQEAAADRARQHALLVAARQEEDYLRHREAELADLAAVPGEEGELAERRQKLMNREKLMGGLAEAQALLVGNGGARERLTTALRRLERQMEPETSLEGAAAALARALVELDEAEAELEAVVREAEDGGDTLDAVEGRLFALRDAARKHRVAADELPALLAKTQALLAGIDHGSEELLAADRLVAEREATYLDLARHLSQGRAQAAERLAQAVMAELAPLKLERTRFKVALLPLEPADIGPAGLERVAFEISTNPGSPFGPLGKIASGGELSRIMLALKVVLAKLGTAPTMIFDEVDAGIGGAVADAVGQRLSRLAEERQILVVTHAPQVAARGGLHLTVAKENLVDGNVRVLVRTLAPAERPAEIARMLAGARITEAALAAANSLLEQTIAPAQPETTTSPKKPLASH